jgi:5-(carboxyamino)imidazole ribonucleotide synthase
LAECLPSPHAAWAIAYTLFRRTKTHRLDSSRIREVAASYDDEAAIRDFARGVDVLTFEFENIPSQSIAWAAEECVVHPAGRALHLCQHRLREKHFLQDAGFPLPRFFSVESKGELFAAVAQIGTPCVLKTASFGYDGKGQRKIDGFTDLALLWDEAIQGVPAGKSAGENGARFVVEAWVEFDMEISVIVARGVRGEMVSFPVCENQHRRHILDLTMVPARIDNELAAGHDSLPAMWRKS